MRWITTPAMRKQNDELWYLVNWVLSEKNKKSAKVADLVFLVDWIFVSRPKPIKFYKHIINLASAFRKDGPLLSYYHFSCPPLFTEKFEY